MKLARELALLLSLFWTSQLKRANKMAKPPLTSDHRDIHNLYVGINDNILLSHQFANPTWLNYTKALQFLGLRMTESILRY